MNKYPLQFLQNPLRLYLPLREKSCVFMYVTVHWVALLLKAITFRQPIKQIVFTLIRIF